MADIQTQARRNPRTGKDEDYITLRWVDPLTRKRKAKSLGFISMKEARAVQKMKEAELLLVSQGASISLRDDNPSRPAATPFGAQDQLSASGGEPAVARGQGTQSPTLRDWLEAHYLPLFQVEHAPKTVAQETGAAAWLAELLGHVRLDELTTRHVEQYKVQRLTTATRKTGRPPSPVTVNIELRVLRSALRVAIELGFLTSPGPRIRQLTAPRSAKRYLTPQEVEAILAAAHPSAGGDRDEGTWLALLLMANLGLRKGEALTREWSDIDFDEGVVRVTHKPRIQWYVKGGRKRRGRERAVPMTPEVREAFFQARIVAGQPKSGWVFPGGRRGGAERPRADCKKGLAGAARRAGVSGVVHPHLLRHAWASRLAMAGVDRKSLQELGGWEDGRMLDEVYAHVTPDHLKDIMARSGIGAPRSLAVASPAVKTAEDAK